MRAQAAKMKYAYGAMSFFLLFTSWAIWWGFFQLWLTSKAGGIMLTGAQVGIFFSIYAIASVCVLFGYGALQDRLGLRRQILIFVAALAALNGPFVTWILRPLLQYNFAAGVIVGAAFFAIAFAGAMAIIEAYFGRFCVRTGIIYGHMRMWGSVGYAVALVSAGFLFTIDPLMVFWASSLLGLILLIVQLFWKVEIPPQELPNQIQAATPAQTPPATSEAIRELIYNRNFWAVVGFALLTWSVYQIYESQMFPDFYTDHFLDEALGQKIFGIFIGVQAGIEALLMSIVPFVIARFGAKRTLLASALVMAFIVFGSATATSVALIMLTKIFHALMVPLIVLGLMDFITHNFDLRLTATVYLVGFYVTSYIGNILLSQPFGMLRDAIGYQGVFVIFGCAMLLGFFLALFAFADDPRRVSK
ncbi:oligosaccharide MFS transporter [Arcanobacterium hippocoleae]|nr:oligosaccharide MFS transporter [Arcanobacterium hippocoleae]